MATAADVRQAEIENSQAETRKFLAEADQARSEERYNLLQIDKLEHEKRLRDAAEYTNRIYTFDAVVKGETVQDCIMTLGMWRRQDPAMPIQVVFNSPGGNVIDGLALFDYIRQARDNGTQVDTVALGMAASMGGVLLQAGETRTMGRHSYLLIHEVTAGSHGNASELEDSLKFTKRLQTRLLDILAERSTLSKRAITTRWKRKDWWLDADEALKLGFCDEVK